tara:strand:+ start:838 stop:1320 length:483 start_codon:yes stop_codon:yes gene_type:complete
MKKATRKGTRPQTDAEAKEIKRITHSKFPKAFNQDAHDAPRHADGRRKTVKTESIVNSYRDLGYLIAEIGRGPKNDKNKKRTPNLGDAVRLAKPHTPSNSVQNNMDSANAAIDQKDGEARASSSEAEVPGMINPGKFTEKLKQAKEWIKKKLKSKKEPDL